MGGYELQVAASAERALARFPEAAITAIIEFMTGPLLADPQRLGKPLKLELELEGYFSARRGAYRVIYSIDDAECVVRVVCIDHRSDVYRPR